MRISHELARTIATSLLSKSKEANEKLRAEIDAMAIAEYQLYIPLEILKVAQTCPSWVEKKDSISVQYRIDGGVHHHRAYTEKGKKSIILKAGDDTLKVNSKSGICRKLVRLQKAQDEYWKLRKETIQAIVDLGTSKRVIEQFPETAVLFKTQPRRSPMPAQKVNLSGLKKKLQKQ